jgi:hypothetical protein
MGQLTLGGGEVERPQTHGQPLSPAETAVLDALREKGSIRSVEAGVIFHRSRGKCGVGRRTDGFEGVGIGCCAYAAADGNEVLKRLMKRGLVRRSVERGRWELVPVVGGLRSG